MVAAFWQERAIRRTARVLEVERQRFYQDLNGLLEGISRFIVPVKRGGRMHPELDREVLQQALDRLGDRAFADWVLGAIARGDGQTHLARRKSQHNC